ncbi:MAG TPA: VOC family protein [Homoserinimonas sp.]|nr:VOC family protein [Homoserinimonas sp.]
MSDAKATLGPTDTAAELEGTGFVHLDGVLYATYKTGDFESAAALVAQVAQLADAQNHHPDIRLGYGSAEFELSSHDAGGVTDRDITLARGIHELAHALGATIETVQRQRHELAIDCVDADAVRDFWRVGMGYVESPSDGDIDLIDPSGRGPKVWFQHMDPPRTDRNRIHVDVYVPTSAAEQRVQDIVGAGGFLLTDEFAPDWWVLADVEGNELCVCTSDA